MVGGEKTGFVVSSETGFSETYDPKCYRMLLTFR